MEGVESKRKWSNLFTLKVRVTWNWWIFLTLKVNEEGGMKSQEEWNHRREPVLHSKKKVKFDAHFKNLSLNTLGSILEKTIYYIISTIEYYA